MTSVTEGYAVAKAREALATAELRFEQAINRFIRWLVGAILAGIATTAAITNAIVNGS